MTLWGVGSYLVGWRCTPGGGCSAAPGVLGREVTVPAVMQVTIPALCRVPVRKRPTGATGMSSSAVISRANWVAAAARSKACRAVAW